MLSYLVTGLLVTLPSPVAPVPPADQPPVGLVSPAKRSPVGPASPAERSPDERSPVSLSEPAPTDVRLAWEPGTPPTYFAVTWQEAGNPRNRVELVMPDGRPAGWSDTLVEADQPNRVVWYGAIFYDQDLRFRVSVIDAAGAPLSERALSPAFDTDAPPAPVLRQVVPRVDGTVLMQWSPGVMPVDDTPDDPLDLPEDPPRFIPVASDFNRPDYPDLSPPTTATTFVVPARRMPQVVGVKTAPNGWSWNAASAEVNGGRLTSVVPRTATDGRPLRVTGTTYVIFRYCDLSACQTLERPDDGRLLELQSRTGPAAAWQVVGTTTSIKDGAFRFTVTSPGSRQYRVVAPPLAAGPGQGPRGFFAGVPASTTSRPLTSGPPPTGGGGSDGGGSDGDGADDGGSGGGADGPLPITGGPVTTVAGTGGLFVAFGALLYWAARRRRATEG